MTAKRQQDEHLGALLREWKAVEPGVGFEAAVWRRLREAEEQPVGAVVSGWRNPASAWINVAAAAAAVVIAMGVAFAVPRAQEDRHVGGPLLHRHTLVGAYLSVTIGGSR